MASGSAAPSAARLDRGAASFAPARALTRRALADARVRTISFAALFGFFAYLQPVAYRKGYPTIADRIGFAKSFADNKAVRLFYGEPHDLLTVGGYTAWRVGGTLAIAAAAFGLLAAVRALRSDEDSGRAELVLSGNAGRRTVYLSSLAAIAASIAIVALAEFAGLVAGGLAAGESLLFAAATGSVACACAGIGAVASQAAPSRRVALELGGGVIALLFVLRVIADTTSGVGWLRWATPLGWAEEARPYSGGRPLVLVLPAVAAAALLLLAGWIALRRDVGTGLFAPRDSAPPRFALLSSPTAQALRGERSTLLVWLAVAGALSFIVGAVARSTSKAGISPSLNREFGKLGSGTITTPAGYLGFAFIFVVLAVSLFSCTQVAAARREEAGEQLETLLALPLARLRWLGGRLVLAAGGAIAISLVAGLFAWFGAEASGAHLPFGKLIEAGANCLPAALLFLAFAALAFGLLPRASAAIAYALVAVAFVWYLLGALLDAPDWLVKLTPFEHVAAVPATPFDVGGAGAMLGIAALATLAALVAFSRRDLAGE